MLTFTSLKVVPLRNAPIPGTGVFHLEHPMPVARTEPPTATTFEFQMPLPNRPIEPVPVPSPFARTTAPPPNPFAKVRTYNASME